jgi:hypothetical protein
VITAVHVILKGLEGAQKGKATNLTYMYNFLFSSDIHLFDDQHRAISWCGTVLISAWRPCILTEGFMVFFTPTSTILQGI